MNVIEKNSDLIKVVALVLYAIILVYFTPAVVRDTGFLCLMPFIWRSKKDYIWIAFFLILVSYPGGLFNNHTSDARYRLPLFALSKGLSLSFENLFCIVLIAKSIRKRQIMRNFMKPFFTKQLYLILLIYIIEIIVTPFVGLGSNSLKDILNSAINLFYVFAVIILLAERESFIRFAKILFPFVFVAVVLQIYFVINQQAMGILIDPFMRQHAPIDSQTDPLLAVLRPVELSQLIVMTFGITLFFLYYKIQEIGKIYLIVVNVVSFFSLLLAATRTYLFACLVSYVIFYLISFTKLRTMAYISLVFVILGYVVASYTPFLTGQIQDSIFRFETLGEGLNGDLTFGGSAKRYDVRAPIVMEGFMKSTIIYGAGFGKLYDEYSDGHTGYINMLFEVGIFGLIAYLIVITRLLYQCFTIKVKDVNNDKILKVAVIPLVFLLILNFSNEFLSFNLPLEYIYQQIFVLLIIHFAYTNGNFYQQKRVLGSRNVIEHA